MDSALQPINVQSTTERVTLALREAIFTRKLLPGQKIIQADLAKQLQVSITPVREALMILETEQLVKIQPRKETIILGVTPKYLEDYWSTRAVIESYLVSLVCSPDTDISSIEDAHQKSLELLEREDYDSYSSTNTVFHRAIWNTANNQLMINLLNQIGVSKSMSKTSNPKEYALQSYHEHEKIMKYIRLHDAENASKEMKNHMLRALNDTMSYYNENE